MIDVSEQHRMGRRIFRLENCENARSVNEADEIKAIAELQLLLLYLRTSYYNVYHLDQSERSNSQEIRSLKFSSISAALAFKLAKQPQQI